MKYISLVKQFNVSGFLRHTKTTTIPLKFLRAFQDELPFDQDAAEENTFSYMPEGNINSNNFLRAQLTYEIKSLKAYVVGFSYLLVILPKNSANSRRKLSFY